MLQKQISVFRNGALKKPLAVILVGVVLVAGLVGCALFEGVQPPDPQTTQQSQELEEPQGEMQGEYGQLDYDELENASNILPDRVNADFIPTNGNNVDFAFDKEAVELQRILRRFPHVGEQQFISLDNGTLVDTRLFEAWLVPNDFDRNFDREDLEFIFGLLIRHFDYVNSGDWDRFILSTTAVDDAEYRRLQTFMENHKGSFLFVERVELSSVGGGIRVIVSNNANKELHIWPLFERQGSGHDEWHIIRYFNHYPEFIWIPEHEHLWEYAKPFQLTE